MKARIDGTDNQVLKINRECLLQKALQEGDIDRAVHILEMVTSYIGLPIELCTESACDSMYDRALYNNPNYFYRIPMREEFTYEMRYRFELPKELTKRLFDDDFLNMAEAMEGGFEL